MTLPILRQVAPRAFVNHVWQAALHDGRASRLVCPACAQPFTEFADPQAQIKVCVRCFWVWFSAETLSLSGVTILPPTLDPVGPLREGTTRRDAAASGLEARRVLGSLAAGELAAALPRAPTSRRRRPSSD